MESDRFYELKIGSSEVQLRVRPREGGKGANLNDIQKELSQLDISYRIDHLFDIYRRSSDQFETLAKRETTEFEIQVNVDSEGFEAHMTVIAPQVGEDKLTPAKIKTALEEAKVEKGIQYDEIKRVIAGKTGDESVLIAKGVPPVHGEDGWIEFNPENKKDASAAVKQNKADYKEMNLIKGVEEGHLIATIYPPTKGSDGFDVKGDKHKGKDGKRAKYRLGANTRLNEEGTEIYASSSGFVVFSGEKVSVEDVFEVPNVDSASGNIRFSGVVRVRGQVEDGYLIEGAQGIEVNGTVGRARLKSRGEIRVGGGALGAKLISGKSVTAKFFSECEVKAAENVVAEDYILHSTVQAGKVVQVVKPGEGFITGGVVQAGMSVWCAVLGSVASEENTRVEVGAEVHLRRDFNRLTEQMDHGREKFDKIRKNIRVLQAQREKQGELPEETAETFERLLAAGQALRGQLLGSLEEYRRMFSVLSNDSNDDGYIFVSSVANPGARIQIRRFPLNLVTPLKSCAFRISNNELKVQDHNDALRVYKMQFGKLPA